MLGVLPVVFRLDMVSDPRLLGGEMEIVCMAAGGGGRGRGGLCAPRRMLRRLSAAGLVL